MNEQDFFNVALNYPTSQLQDFERAGLTKDNVTLKDKEYYKQFEQVQNVFKDESGKFSEDRYNKWYGNVLSKYNDFTNDQYSKNIMDSDVRYVMTDSAIYNQTQGTTPTVVMPEAKRKVDVFGRTTGMVGINSVSDKFNSEREFIQQQKMYDANGKKLDYTPEDIGFFGTIANPIRQAVYDKDEKDEQGNIIHRKGDTKLDSEGLPYMEYIGNRDNSGLEQYQLNPFDVLVSEKSSLNPIAIWEDDDLKKNPYAALAKNTAKVGIMAAAAFYAPPVATALALGMAGLALMDIIPEYLKTYSAGVNSDVKDTPFYKSLNWLQTRATAFNTTQSDYAQENPFGIENVSGMMPMIYAQLFQMRGVFSGASIGSKLLGASDKTATTIGSLASSAFMTGLGASEMSKEAKKLGLDDKETAALLTGATAGLAALYNLPFTKFSRWAVDETYAGKVISKELPYITSLLGDNKNVVKEVIKHESDKWVKTLGKNTIEELTTQEKKEWYKRIPSIIKDAFSPNPNALQSNFVDYLKAGGAEALEEVTEQGILDGIKLGYNTYWSKDKKFDKLFDPENYALSAIGGAMGGSMFKMIDVMSNKAGKEAKNEFNTTVFDLLEQGKSEEEITKIIDETVPQYVNTKLSTELDEEGNYKAATDRSQADDVKDFLKQSVRDIKAARDNIGGIKEIANQYNQDIKNTILDMNLDSTLRDDISDSIDNIVTAKQELKQLMNEKDVDLDKVKIAKEKIDKANKSLQDIKNRTNTDYYYQQGLFSINASLQDPFLYDGQVSIDITKDKIARQKYLEGNEAKGFKDLNDDQKATVNELYNKSKSENVKSNKQNILKAQDSLNKLIKLKEKDINAIQSDIERQADFDLKTQDEVAFLQSIADKDTLTLNEKTRLGKIDLKKYADELNFKDIFEKNLSVDPDTGITFDNLPDNLKKFFHSYMRGYFGENYAFNRDAMDFIDPFVSRDESIKELEQTYISENPQLFQLKKAVDTGNKKPLAHQFTKDADIMADIVLKGKKIDDADFENYDDFDATIRTYKEKLAMLTYTGLINPEVQTLRDRISKTNPAFAEAVKAKGELIVSDLENSRLLINHIKEKINTLSEFRDKAYANSKKKMRLVKLEWLKDVVVKANTLAQIAKLNNSIKVDFSNDFTTISDKVNAIIASNKPITNINIGKEEEEVTKINELYRELIKNEEEVHKQLTDESLKEILVSTGNLKTNKEGKLSININAGAVPNLSDLPEDSFFMYEKINDNNRNNPTQYVTKDGVTTKIGDPSINRILSKDGMNYLFYLYLANPKDANIAVYNSIVSDNTQAPLQHQYASLLYSYSYINSTKSLKDLDFGFVKYNESTRGYDNFDDASFLNNSLIVEGTVGTGKTKILKELNNLLKTDSNVKIKYYAPNEKQRENLSKVIGSIELLSNNDDTDIVKLANEAVSDNKQLIVVIDEIQSFNKETIKNLVSNDKIKFIFTGDLQQLGYNEGGSRKHIGEGLYLFSPPKFDFIVRNGFDNLPDTIANIRTALNPISPYSGAIVEHEIKSKFYAKTDDVDPKKNDFNGVYVTNDLNNANKILGIIKNQMATTDSSVAIITSNQADSDKLIAQLDIADNPNKITLGSDKIKGSEADYVILLEDPLDFNSSFKDNDKRQLEFYLTNIGRAKKGIIVLQKPDEKDRKNLVKFENQEQDKWVVRSSFTTTDEASKAEYKNYIDYVSKVPKINGTVEAKPNQTKEEKEKAEIENEIDDNEDLTKYDEVKEAVQGVTRINFKEKLNNGLLVKRFVDNLPENQIKELDIAFREYVLAKNKDEKEAIKKRIKKIANSNAIDLFLAQIDKVINFTIKKVLLTEQNYSTYFDITESSKFDPKQPIAYFIGLELENKTKVFYNVGAITYTSLKNQGFNDVIDLLNKKESITINKTDFLKKLTFQRSELNENYGTKLTVKELKEKYPNYEFSEIYVGTYKDDLEGTNYKKSYNGTPIILYAPKSHTLSRKINSSDMLSKMLSGDTNIGVLRLRRPIASFTKNTQTGFLSQLFAYKTATEGKEAEENLNTVLEPVTAFKYIRTLQMLASELSQKLNLSSTVSVNYKNKEGENAVNNITYSNSEIVEAINSIVNVFFQVDKISERKSRKQDYLEEKKTNPKATLDLSDLYSTYDKIKDNPTNYAKVVRVKKGEAVKITINNTKEDVYRIDYFQLANNLSNLQKKMDNNAGFYDILDAIDVLLEQKFPPIFVGVKAKPNYNNEVANRAGDTFMIKTSKNYETMLEVNAIPKLPSGDIELKGLRALLGLQEEVVVTPKQENTKSNNVFKMAFGVDVNEEVFKVYSKYGLHLLPINDFVNKLKELVSKNQLSDSEIKTIQKNNC